MNKEYLIAKELIENTKTIYTNYILGIYSIMTNYRGCRAEATCEAIKTVIIEEYFDGFEPNYASIEAHDWFNGLNPNYFSSYDMNTQKQKDTEWAQNFLPPTTLFCKDQ